jgi:N-dimethylarginine dimethylaminohydrolase
VLAEVAALDGLTTTVLQVRGGLHLKLAMTLASENVLLHAPEVAADDLAPVRALGPECIAAREPAGANVLALGGVTLVSADAPEAARALEARGLAVHRLPMGEIHTGDGALTCLSLRLPAPGAWCT